MFFQTNKSARFILNYDPASRSWTIDFYRGSDAPVQFLGPVKNLSSACQYLLAGLRTLVSQDPKTELFVKDFEGNWTHYLFHNSRGEKFKKLNIPLHGVVS